MNGSMAVIPGWDGPPFWFALVPALLIVIALVPWIVGAVFVLKGDTVQMSNRAAQLYGYTVCLIALIIALTSISSILNAVLERGHPLQREFGYGASLTSFESYKATRRTQEPFVDRGAPQPDTASDATLRQRYDALVADRIAMARYQTTKSLITSSIMLLVAVVLFGLHWRWLRRINGAGHASA